MDTKDKEKKPGLKKPVKLIPGEPKIGQVGQTLSEVNKGLGNKGVKKPKKDSN